MESTALRETFACPRCHRDRQPGLALVRHWEGLVDRRPSWLCAMCFVELQEAARRDPMIGGIEIVEVRGTFTERSTRVDSVERSDTTPGRRPRQPSDGRPSQAAVEV